MQKYGEQGTGQPNLRVVKDDFEDFVLQVPFSNKIVEILCCPEDRRCSRPGCTQHDACCEECEVPCCRECKAPSGISFWAGEGPCIFGFRNVLEPRGVDTFGEFARRLLSVNENLLCRRWL